MYIQSPRYPRKYYSNWLVFYNVSCGEGYFMTLDFKHFDLQEKLKINGRKTCADYVNISAPSSGRDRIFCGHDNSIPPPIDIPKGEVFITFRTSNIERDEDHKGFRIKVHCYHNKVSSAMEVNCENEVRHIRITIIIDIVLTPLDCLGT